MQVSASMCHIPYLFLLFPLPGTPSLGQTLFILQGPSQMSNVKFPLTLEIETECSVLWRKNLLGQSEEFL